MSTRPPVPAPRHAQELDTLDDDADLGRAVLSSLPAHIAVLDGQGRIVAVNEAWTAFAADNGAHGACGVGCNYLDVCRSAVGLAEAQQEPVTSNQ